MQTALDFTSNDGTHSGLRYFFILATDNTLYRYDEETGLIKINEHSSVPKIQDIPTTDEGIFSYAELDSSNTISIVKYTADKDYVVNVT